jgi:hypothetical protein
MPCQCISLTGDFWRLIAVVRSYAKSTMFAKPLSEQVAKSQCPLIVICVRLFDFLMQRTFIALKSIASLLKCMRKVWNVHRHDLDAYLLSQSIQKTGLMLMSMKTSDSLLMSFRKFYHMFFNLSSVRLSQFNSWYTKICAIWVPRMHTFEHKKKKWKK